MQIRFLHFRFEHFADTTAIGYQTRKTVLAPSLIEWSWHSGVD